MVAFLVKNKWKILSWIIFFTIVLYWVPWQDNYYTFNDIRTFKHAHLTSILLWIGITITVIIVLLVLITERSLVSAGAAFLIVGFFMTVYLFLFKDIVLGATLYLNRQYKGAMVKRSFRVRFADSGKRTKENMLLYEVPGNLPEIDFGFSHTLYKPELQENDIVSVMFYKGLFGLRYSPKAFDKN